MKISKDVIICGRKASNAILGYIIGFDMLCDQFCEISKITEMAISDPICDPRSFGVYFSRSSNLSGSGKCRQGDEMIEDFQKC